MENGKQPRRIPWGSLIVSAMLFTGMYFAYENLILRDREPASTILLLTSFTFVVTLWVSMTVQSAFWGLAAAALFIFHPQYFQLTSSGDWQTQAVLVVELVTLLCMLGVWHLFFRESPTVLGLIFPVGLLIITGVCGWLLSPHAGWVTGFLTGTGFLFVAILSAVAGKQNLRVRLIRSATALICACAIPILCLILSPPALKIANEVFDVRMGRWLQPAMEQECTVETILSIAYQPQIIDNPLPGFHWNELSGWTWPQMYVTLALMGLACWLSLRRGWKYYRGNRLPLSWALLLFTVCVLAANAIHPQSVRNLRFMPLCSIAVLLSIFCLGDLFLSFGEAVRLQPPETETEKQAQMAKDT